jgi:succinate dehydrogenase / fumarate reductase cytochrome b subunit
MAKGLRFAYYPGCVAQGSAREVEDAMQGLSRVLGLELLPMMGAACCGAGVMKQANWKLQAAINARTFSQAEAAGLDVLTPCASCQGNMHEDLVTLQGDAGLREEVNIILERVSGLRFEGTLRMRHLLQVLVEDIGLDVIRDKVVNPIDFPIAGYYGAPMQQEGACGEDDVYDPSYFEQLITALGGKPVDWDGRTSSVGFPGLLAEEKSAMKMTAAVLSEAKQEGAKIMATACPLSHVNLDTYQVKAGKVAGLDTSLPVIHLPELVAWALGCDVGRLAQLRTRALVIGD